MALKDNLKRLREQAGYTQAKSFSKVAGIPYSSYAPYERGAWPNEKNLIKIAKTLHVSIDELLGYSPSQSDELEKWLLFVKIMVSLFFDGKIHMLSLHTIQKINLCRYLILQNARNLCLTFLI